MTWSGLNSLPWFWKPFRTPGSRCPWPLIGPGILAFLLGYIVFRSRVKGVYFSIVTQALALILSTFFVGQQPYTGGTNGITNYSQIFGDEPGLDFDAAHRCYYATAAILLMYLPVRHVDDAFPLRAADGRHPRRRGPVALRAATTSRFVKALVFAISGAIAGLAGALFVPQVGIISPANLGIVPSIEFVLLVAVGGRGTLTGAVIGAVVVSWARSYAQRELPRHLAVLLRRAVHGCRGPLPIRNRWRLPEAGRRNLRTAFGRLSR